MEGHLPISAIIRMKRIHKIFHMKVLKYKQPETAWDSLSFPAQPSVAMGHWLQDAHRPRLQVSKSFIKRGLELAVGCLATSQSSTRVAEAGLTQVRDQPGLESRTLKLK